MNFEGGPGWKRAIDIGAGGLALLVAVIPMVVISVGISLDSGFPIVIRQRRIGLAGREFLMWKFRTLPAGTPQIAKSELIRKGLPELSQLAQLLRRYSLDELPQLLNVL